METVSPYYRLAKRLLDIVLCTLALPVALPLLLLCAVAVYIDSPGPIIYANHRTGRHGRAFRMLKFRTMVRNAEELKEAVAHLNVLPPPDFKIPNDPRITRVGRFLRATSLDELPQVFNVLRGDMSLVGPRPTDFGPATWSLWHTQRLDVVPGITGLWQIEGRAVTSFDERLRMDVHYIRNMSLKLDLRLLARTIPVILKRTGK